MLQKYNFNNNHQRSSHLQKVNSRVMCRSDTHLAINTMQEVQRAEFISWVCWSCGSASPAAWWLRCWLNLTLCRDTLAFVDHLVAVGDLGAVGASQLHLLLTDFFLAATFTLVIHHVCLCWVSVGKDGKGERLILHVVQLGGWGRFAFHFIQREWSEPQKSTFSH